MENVPVIQIKHLTHYEQKKGDITLEPILMCDDVGLVKHKTEDDFLRCLLLILEQPTNDPMKWNVYVTLKDMRCFFLFEFLDEFPDVMEVHRIDVVDINGGMRLPTDCHIARARSRAEFPKYEFSAEELKKMKEEALRLVLEEESQQTGPSQPSGQKKRKRRSKKKGTLPKSTSAQDDVEMKDDEERKYVDGKPLPLPSNQTRLHPADTKAQPHPPSGQAQPQPSSGTHVLLSPHSPTSRQPKFESSSEEWAKAKAIVMAEYVKFQNRKNIKGFLKHLDEVMPRVLPQWERSNRIEEKNYARRFKELWIDSNFTPACFTFGLESGKLFMQPEEVQHVEVKPRASARPTGCYPRLSSNEFFVCDKTVFFVDTEVCYLTSTTNQFKALDLLKNTEMYSSFAAPGQGSKQFLRRLWRFCSKNESIFKDFNSADGFEVEWNPDDQRHEVVFETGGFQPKLLRDNLKSWEGETFLNSFTGHQFDFLDLFTKSGKVNPKIGKTPAQPFSVLYDSDDEQGTVPFSISIEGLLQEAEQAQNGPSRIEAAEIALPMKRQLSQEREQRKVKSGPQASDLKALVQSWKDPALPHQFQALFEQVQQPQRQGKQQATAPPSKRQRQGANVTEPNNEE